MQSTGINRWKEPHEAVQAKKVLSYHLNTLHISNITIAEDFGSITDEKKMHLDGKRGILILRISFQMQVAGWKKI